jgi:hypothetical protein
MSWSVDCGDLLAFFEEEFDVRVGLPVYFEGKCSEARERPLRGVESSEKG